MAKYEISPRLRQQWNEEKVISLHEHPAHFTKLAMVPEGGIGYIREVEDLSGVADVVAGLIRAGSVSKFALYLGTPLQPLLAARVFQEALVEYLLRGDDATAWIISGDQAIDLHGSTVQTNVQRTLLDFYDLRQEIWYPPKAAANYQPYPERFLVTDYHAWWINECLRSPTDLASAYAFQSPEKSKELWNRFNAHYNAFCP